jgi:hypothetical protein
MTLQSPTPLQKTLSVRLTEYPRAFRGGLHVIFDDGLHVKMFDGY